MMMTMDRYVASAFLVLVMGCFAVACSDDTTEESGGAQNCAAGESYNSLSGQCEPELRGDNNAGTNNAGTNNAGTNNGGTNNGGSNNGGTNNGGSNNNNNGGDAGPGDDSGGNNNPGDDGGGGELGCGPGAIIGKACAPSGEVLGGATVTIEGFDCDGNAYTDTVQTNTDGEFQFDDVPSGQHTVTISTGSFSRNQTVIVQHGETLDLSTAAAKICLDGGNVKIAVIEGAYDHVSGILDDLALDYDVKGDDKVSNFLEPNGRYSDSVAFLKNSSAMAEYDIIFINCGELWNRLGQNNPGDVSTIISNLASYLGSGNSLYVSDWSHPFLEKVYADAVDFHGDDQTINDARIGYAPQTISAAVTSPGLQNVLGSSQATIDFPHDPYATPAIINNNWVMAEGAGAASTIHLSGDALLCPQPFSPTSSCNSSAGTQPDSPLLVSYKNASGGTAVYTSFHNERQAAINQDMEKILKFLIFQL
jgi:hypothetical protein